MASACRNLKDIFFLITFHHHFYAKNGKISPIFYFELVNEGWIIAILCGYIPYARHYNPRFVYFLPHFWRPKTFLRSCSRKFLTLCTVSIQERAGYNGARTVYALTKIQSGASMSIDFLGNLQLSNSYLFNSLC